MCSLNKFDILNKICLKGVFAMKFKPIKVSELAEISNRSVSLTSQYFKDAPDDKVTRINNRIIGISPDLAEEYLRHCEISYLHRPAIIICGNLRGGTGKTTVTYNLGLSIRRIINLQTALVFIDGDSQGDFSETIFGESETEKEPILMDYLMGRCTLDDVLYESDNNTWFIRANGRQAWTDKCFLNNKEIKLKMLNLYQEIFKKFGPNTKIFQDQKPELSSLFGSSICALYQIPDSVLKCFLIPMTSDKRSIRNANRLIEEARDVKEQYNFNSDGFHIKCLFSKMDNRIPKVVRLCNEYVNTKEKVRATLSAMPIRYSSEVPISEFTATNIFTLEKNIKPAEDYKQLMLDVFSLS